MFRFLSGLFMGALVSGIGLGALSLTLPLPYYHDGLTVGTSDKDDMVVPETKPEADTSEMGTPETSEPERTAPDMAMPDITAPEAPGSETSGQDTASDTAGSDTTESALSSPEQGGLRDELHPAEILYPAEILHPVEILPSDVSPELAETPQPVEPGQTGTESQMAAPGTDTIPESSEVSDADTATGKLAMPDTSDPDTLGILQGEDVTRAPDVPAAAAVETRFSTPASASEDTVPTVPPNAGSVAMPSASPPDQVLSESSPDDLPGTESHVPEIPKETILLQEIVIPGQLTTPALETQDSGF